MVLDRYRAAADRLLVPVARRLIRVNPDAVSWAGLFAAAGAGASFVLGGSGFLGLALVLLIANAYFDALDGKIAKLAGTASVRGDFLDHVLDRYADVFLIGGVAFSAYCQLWIGPIGSCSCSSAGSCNSSWPHPVVCCGAWPRSRSSRSSGSSSSSRSSDTRPRCSGPCRRGADSPLRSPSTRSRRAADVRDP